MEISDDISSNCEYFSLLNSISFDHTSYYVFRPLLNFVGIRKSRDCKTQRYENAGIGKFRDKNAGIGNAGMKMQG